MNKVSKLKNKIVILSLLLITVAVGITFAIQQNKANSLRNTFVVATVDTDIDEPPVVVEDGEIIKKPYIENGAENGSALVRAKVSITPAEIKKDFNIDVKINSEYWTEYNGYYYYNNILKKGEKSQPLFTEVTGKNLVNDGKINTALAGLEIIVYHESVQPVVGDIEANTGVRKERNNTDRIWTIDEDLNR